MTHKLVLSLLSATTMTGMAACPAVFATQAHAAEDAARPDANEAIIVTGLKPDEGQNRVSQGGALGAKALLDTPYSVTVIDADDIARRQANSIGQIFANDPSVFSSAPSGSTNWWGTQIRGLGVRNYYIDDVPLLLYWGGDFLLEPIESVTALKGLTGFMYGFGAPGGVISYQTKRPAAKCLTRGVVSAPIRSCAGSRSARAVATAKRKTRLAKARRRLAVSKRPRRSCFCSS
ncbi:tonB-dependent Receptor Plug domain protein [Sphingobium sp. RAC03]|nr:tonB-dependent Receptor Plug domain protein [Sphingobium sp. RAC03]